MLIRKFSPLAATVTALLLAVFALPSALNLPQANPTQTLEYAPVPGQSNSSSSGNFAGLGLGAGGEGTGGLPEQPQTQGGGTGATPTAKQCVGSPPRQDEDPLSPPCVPFFRGDNGGATYQGVTKTEVRVLFYIEGGSASPGTNQGYVDIGTSAAQNDPASQMVQVLQSYFNSRYQTYGRFVHFWTYFTNYNASTPPTPDQRRQDAADNYNHVHPAIVLIWALTAVPAYMEAMAQRGVISIMGTSDAQMGESVSYFQKYPDLLWSYFPSLEERAKQVANVVCSEMAGRVATYAGTALYNGKVRTFGLIRDNNSTLDPEETLFGSLVKDDMEACGAHLTDDRAYYDGGLASSNPAACHACPGQAMASFEQENISTVVDAYWDGGITVDAAQSAGYQPEWLFAGTGGNDITETADLQPQSEMAHSWVVTVYSRRGPLIQDDYCYQAVNSADNGQGDPLGYGCFYYSGLRQVFTGIQLAGPDLTPQNLSQGFHAIPGRPTPDPRVPACFYPAGDNTCVHDATAEWWDPSGSDPEFQQGGGGCWRLVDQGQRFLLNTWPKVELTSREKLGSDPCNSQTGNS